MSDKRVRLFNPHKNLAVNNLVMNRYVIDGWPLTKSHVDLLTKFHLIPVCIVEVDVSNEEILRRAAIERKSLNR